jgi:hypothetical protein
MYQILEINNSIIVVELESERDKQNLCYLWESLLRLSLCVERERERRLVAKGWERESRNV